MKFFLFLFENNTSFQSSKIVSLTETAECVLTLLMYIHMMSIHTYKHVCTYVYTVYIILKIKYGLI